MNLLRAGFRFGMAGWQPVCVLVLVVALCRTGESCPSACMCAGFRIYCTDTERGIAAFPVLSEAEMENITDIYIANQSSFSSINEKDLTFYRNLRNLTVTNTRLTYVSRQAFRNNVKLQYLNLKDNNLSSLSWKTVHHLNISYLGLSGNPLQCICENMWMKQGRGEESEAAELLCVEEGGKRRHLSRLTLPDCVVPTVNLKPERVTLRVGSNVTLTCNTSGTPTPDLTWNTCTLNSSREIVTTGQSTELRLADLSPLDNECKITCSADNTAGESDASLHLDILFPPTISKLLDAISDHHWCIPFSVSGNPQPKLHWLLQGEPVIEGDFISTRIHDYSEHEYHGCLQLDNPTHINNGEYTLLASNPYGKDQKTIFAHFMHTPWNDSTATDSLYYDPTTDDTPLGPPDDQVAVYVVVGIAVITFTGFVLMLVVLKFGRNSKFGIKGFVLFHNVPVEVVSR